VANLPDSSANKPPTALPPTPTSGRVHFQFPLNWDAMSGAEQEAWCLGLAREMIAAAGRDGNRHPSPTVVRHGPILPFDRRSSHRHPPSGSGLGRTERRPTSWAVV
jgi:hypothetical protein